MMSKLRQASVVLGMLLALMAPASQAQLSIRLSTPNLSIGIHLPAYPQLVLIPGYPVYYAPGLQINYFFYDGYYWVFQNGTWYASTWYDGPWAYVAPIDVPAFILRIPVRYYRHPPAFFQGWRPDAPPHWGQHWGRSWEQHRSGWNRWDQRATPPPAPLPNYQRRYPRDSYPRQLERQRELERRYYRARPPALQYQHEGSQGASPRGYPRTMPQPPQRYPQANRPESPQGRQRNSQSPGPHKQGGGSEYRQNQRKSESQGPRGQQRQGDIWWYQDNPQR